MTADMAAAYAADSTELDAHEVEARFAASSAVYRRCEPGVARATIAFMGRLATAYERTRRGATDHVADILERTGPR